MAAAGYLAAAISMEGHRAMIQRHNILNEPCREAPDTVWDAQ